MSDVDVVPSAKIMDIKKDWLKGFADAIATPDIDFKRNTNGTSD